VALEGQLRLDDQPPLPARRGLYARQHGEAPESCWRRRRGPAAAAVPTNNGWRREAMASLQANLAAVGPFPCSSSAEAPAADSARNAIRGLVVPRCGACRGLREPALLRLADPLGRNGFPRVFAGVRVAACRQGRCSPLPPSRISQARRLGWRLGPTAGCSARANAAAPGAQPPMRSSTHAPSPFPAAMKPRPSPLQHYVFDSTGLRDYKASRANNWWARSFLSLEVLPLLGSGRSRLAVSGRSLLNYQASHGC